MKEFEKWNKKNPSHYVLEKGGREDGWEAAFKLINSWLWLASGRVVDEVKDRIKQELEQ